MFILNLLRFLFHSQPKRGLVYAKRLAHYNNRDNDLYINEHLNQSRINTTHVFCLLLTRPNELCNTTPHFLSTNILKQLPTCKYLRNSLLDV